MYTRPAGARYVEFCGDRRLCLTPRSFDAVDIGEGEGLGSCESSWSKRCISSLRRNKTNVRQSEIKRVIGKGGAGLGILGEGVGVVVVVVCVCVCGGREEGEGAFDVPARNVICKDSELMLI